jgi:hypothetical protein
VSAEFILSFSDEHWYVQNKGEVEAKIQSLLTFLDKKDFEYRMCGIERGARGRWEYDVRIFLKETNIFLEISSHSSSVEVDLRSLFDWIRSKTKILIADEDGDESGW